MNLQDGAGLSGRLSNFKNTNSVESYPLTATYQSNIYDAGSTVSLNRLSWDQTVPSGTGVSFQIATSSSPSGPWTFVGPDGTAATSWTSSPATLPTSPHPSGRYFRYQATLTSTAGTATPGFSNVQISFSGTGSNASTLMVYAYDAAGNITSKTTTTDSGTATDVRTPNSLNQITTQVVGGVTWTYTWNADGTLASKAGGGNTWAYTWDDVDGQRLINVKLNSVTQIEFSYDTMGRMLTRTPYSGGVVGAVTSFTWDGWDCIKESSSSSTTRYYCPQGELQSFERDGVTYQCHNDALGSVRMVTDNTGAVKARFDYDAWGNLLPTSTDSVPGGMPFRFVGAFGMRWDQTLGVYYARHRFYDPQLQQFLSRDLLVRGIKYTYSLNNPTSIIDVTGLRPSHANTVIYEKLYLQWASKSDDVIGKNGKVLWLALRGPGGRKSLCSMLHQISDSTDTNDDFLEVMQAAFLPNTTMGKLYNLELPASELQGGYHRAFVPGMSGWNKGWRDTLTDSQDQTHHLVAFIIAGYHSYTRAQAEAYAIDILPEPDEHGNKKTNWGDIDLGYLGAGYGNFLKNPDKSSNCSDTPGRRKFRKAWIDALCNDLQGPVPAYYPGQ